MLVASILATGQVGIMNATKSQLKSHHAFLQSKMGGGGEQVLLSNQILWADVRHPLLTPEKAN